MPNWCDNALIISYDNANKEQKRFIEELKASAEKGKMLEFLKPFPKDIEDFREWAIANWGTKWEVDIMGIELTNSQLIISFMSAWSPATRALDTLENKGIDYTLFYFESGVSYYGYKDHSGDYCYEINFETKNLDLTNEDDVYDALVDMCKRDGVDESIIQLFGMSSCYTMEKEDVQVPTN
jgi:hypothetical protein